MKVFNLKMVEAICKQGYSCRYLGRHRDQDFCCLKLTPYKEIIDAEINHYVSTLEPEQQNYCPADEDLQVSMKQFGLNINNSPPAPIGDNCEGAFCVRALSEYEKDLRFGKTN